MGIDFQSYADWLARRQYVINVIWRRTTMKIKDCRTNKLDLFQNWDVPEEVSGTFAPEVDLNDDAVGRSRYERFAARYCDRKSTKTFARAQSSGVPLKEISRVKLRRLIREHISKNMSKSSKIHDYTLRAQIPMYFVM